jgi:hypothetical protein
MTPWCCGDLWATGEALKPAASSTAVVHRALIQLLGRPICAKSDH